jgi:hypothetical protein
MEGKNGSSVSIPVLVQYHGDRSLTQSLRRPFPESQSLYPLTHTLAKTKLAWSTNVHIHTTIEFTQGCLLLGCRPVEN